MKKYILIILVVAALIRSSYGNAADIQNKNVAVSGNTSNQLLTINNLDSVVFDLSQAEDTLNYVFFPVSILSDDSIYALDFSFKFNHNKLVFDSIIDLTNYIQFLSFYNGADSTVRFTCNSLQRYTNDTALVLVRFITLGGPIINSDINTIDVYLNGTSCSLKFVSSLIDEVDELKEDLYKINYYPNPANEVLHINSDRNISIQISDMNGRILKEVSDINSGLNEIDLQNIKSGIYFLIIRDDEKTTTKWFVISR